MLKRVFIGIFNRILFYLNFIWNYLKWSFYEVFIVNLLKLYYESSWYDIYVFFMLIKILWKFLGNCFCGCVENILSKFYLIWLIWYLWFYFWIICLRWFFLGGGIEECD